jgi:hypothetical protein
MFHFTERNCLCFSSFPRLLLYLFESVLFICPLQCLGIAVNVWAPPLAVFCNLSDFSQGAAIECDEFPDSCSDESD